MVGCMADSSRLTAFFLTVKVASFLKVSRARSTKTEGTCAFGMNRCWRMERCRFPPFVWKSPANPRLGVAKIIQSTTVDANTPDLYTNETGPAPPVIRAFKSDGTQVWSWPPTGSAQAFPEMAGADNLGGVLAFTEDSSFNSYFSRIDETGHLVWSHLTGGYDEAFGVAPDGTIYIVDDLSDVSQFVALDPQTGNPKFSIDLPLSQSANANYSINDQSFYPPNTDHGVYGLVCTPGLVSLFPEVSSPAVTNSPGAHGNQLSIASDGTVYLSVAFGTETFDAEP